MRYLLNLLACLIFVSAFADDDDMDDRLIVSTPDQIAAISSDRSSLIGDIVSPLSGQMVLKITDIVVKGAQNLVLDRIYAPPYIPCSFPPTLNATGDIHRYKLYKHLNQHYKGWQFLPHLRLEMAPENVVRITDPNGMTLDYRLLSSSTSTLASLPYAITNTSGDLPSGKYDPRNTRILREDGRIKVYAADGAVRFYKWAGNERGGISIYMLQRETLPNGKVLKYYYNDPKRVMSLTNVHSSDPNERHVYASMGLQDSSSTEYRHFTASDGRTVQYGYTWMPFEGEYKVNKARKKFRLYSPPLLISASSPIYRQESLHYADPPVLETYSGKQDAFTCHYGCYGANPKHYRVHKVLLPVGQNDARVQGYELSYQPPVAGVKEGSTTVKNYDGTSVVYEFSRSLLITAIKYYGQDGALKKQKLFSWYGNHWLQSVEMRDGENHLLHRKYYEYDQFGNPKLEVLSGDLTGSGQTEDYRIQRVFSEDGRNLLLREENENGKVICYSYLPNTNLVTAKLTKEGNAIVLREFSEYDDCNNLVKNIVDDGSSEDINDLSGLTQRTFTNYILRQQAPFLHMPEWIEEKYLEKGEEKLLKSSHLIYDQHGNIENEEIYDATGQLAYVITKTYNERGDVLSETNALGQLATYSYDAKGHRESETNFSGRLHKTIRYDTKGRVREKKERGDDGVEHIDSFDYDYYDRLSRKTDLYGNSTQYTYDPIANQVARTDFPPIASLDGQAVEVATESTYDPFGREITKTDANGHATAYRYNAYGSPIEITHPDGGKEYFRYVKNGDLVSHTDPDGLTIQYDRDILGRARAKTYSSEGEQVAQETFTYSAFNLLCETDKEGNLKEYGYDGAGRKIREEFFGRVVEFKYDSLGRVCTVYKHNGDNSLLINYKRDLLGQILEEEKTDISENCLYKISYAYDKDGNREIVKRYINSREAVDTFRYDPFKRLLEHRDPHGFVTSTSYDENHINALNQKILRTSETDPLNIATVTTKDAFARTVSKEILSPHKAIISHQELIYDPRGNVSYQMDHVYEDAKFQSTQVLAYTYSPGDRIASQIRSFGTKDERTTTFTYTLSGKTRTKTLPDGVTLTYGYDSLGYWRSLNSSDGKIQHAFEHNKLGHLKNAADKNLNIAITREVDPIGNVLRETFSSGFEIEREVDLFNRPTMLKIGNHGAILYTYDSLFLKSVTRIAPTGEELYTHRYDQFDWDGNLISESLIGNLGQVVHETDEIGRRTGSTSSYFTQLCSYDPCSNLTTNIIDRVETRYTYDDLCQLNSETEDQKPLIYAYDSVFNRTQNVGRTSEINALNELLSQAQEHFSYDLNGNQKLKQTSTGTMQFVYDPLNRLVEAQSDQKKAIFTYDPLGRRLSKILYSATPLGWKEEFRESYLYDGQNEIGALDADQQLKNLKVLGLAKYKNNPSPVGIELVNQIFAPILDVQGNVRRLIDLNTRGIADSYDFTAFGVAKRISEQNLFNPWRFASKRLDPEFNLVYFGKRYYDPELARWLTTDPAGFVDSINLYQYVFNNPFRYGDPDGRFVFAIPLATLTWKLVAVAVATAVVTYELERRDRHSSSAGERAFNDAVHQVAQSMWGMAKPIANLRNSEVFAPDRPLPVDEHGIPIPEADVPHTELGTGSGRKGKYAQAREFDAHGLPVKDIDFTDHGRPQDHPCPHQHRREENPSGGTRTREGAEPLSGWNNK